MKAVVAALVLAAAMAAGCETKMFSCPDGAVAVSDPSSRLAYCAPVCTHEGVCSCPLDWVSIWNARGQVAECVPACDADGGCAAGRRCETCLAPGDCRVCSVCVAACVPPP